MPDAGGRARRLTICERALPTVEGMNARPVLTARALRHAYGSTVVLDGAELTIRAGESVALVAVALAMGGGVVLVPGLFLVGFTVGRERWIGAIAGSVRGTALVGAAAALLGAGLFAVAGLEGIRLHAIPSATLGLLMAIVYVCVLLLALHSPLRRTLEATLAPLGRMALTNYLAATLVVVATRPFMAAAGLLEGSDSDWWITLAGCGVLLLVQMIISAAWLSRFSQGPLEAL